jgi:hypothetical protein
MVLEKQPESYVWLSGITSRKEEMSSKCTTIHDASLKTRYSEKSTQKLLFRHAVLKKLIQVSGFPAYFVHHSNQPPEKLDKEKSQECIELLMIARRVFRHQSRASYQVLASNWVVGLSLAVYLRHFAHILTGFL